MTNNDPSRRGDIALELLAARDRALTNWYLDMVDQALSVAHDGLEVPADVLEAIAVLRERIGRRKTERRIVAPRYY